MRGRPALLRPSLAAGLLLVALRALAQDGAAAAPSPDTAVAPEASAARPGVPQLQIDAPTEVRRLLEQHLDLSRAIGQPDAASLSELEWSRLVGSAAAQARQLVQPLGYFQAQASVQREPGPPPRVRLSVDPGPQARVSRLTFEVQGELAELAEAGQADAVRLRRSLQDSWPLDPGRPFSNSAWADAKSATLARLRAEGYASASWAGTAAEVDLALSGLRLFVVADSGPLFRAGEVRISGLQYQNAETVRGLMPFAQGDALTEERLLSYQRQLLKTGLFEGVNVAYDPDPAQAAAAPVTVDLHESPRQAATFGVGYSANTGPRASAEHVQRRLLGRQLSLRNKVVWGASEQSWDGELSTHADTQFSRWLLGGTLDRTVGDTDIVLLQRLRLGRSTEADGRERFHHLDLDRSRECGRETGANCEVLAALSLQSDLTLRRLDNALLPTRGHAVQLGLGAGWARGSQSANGAFGRLYGRAIGYWPVGDSWYAQARVEFGQVLMADAVKVPDALRFRAGGDDSVRGYAYRSLAPVRSDGTLTGGRVLATASAEIARPVSPNLPSVWWAAFVDAGQAADRWRDFDPALGYGVGVRWRSPVGPLKLDLAYGQAVRSVRLHLSVGIAF